MSIVELLQQVGAENVEVQPLNECIDNARVTKRAGVTMVSFPTHKVSCTEIATGEFKYIGLIVWIPKEKVPKL